jgi:dienelactone hydrolase
MRWPFWCSAVLVLVACGGGVRNADPFAYDRATPLAPTAGKVVARGSWATIRAFTFAGAGTSRVPAYLVAPRGTKRLPAVLFLHGSGGTRYDLLLPAVRLARRGFVTMTISYPSDTPTYRPIVVDARRALDLLAARTDVDRGRLGVVGFSLGAQVAAIVAGDDSRVKAVDVIGGRGNDVTLYWIRRARGHLLFQAGTHDQVVPHDLLFALMQAASRNAAIRWYDTGHDVSRQMEADLDGFMVHSLG